MEFFMPMIPPTITFQEKKINKQTGTYYEPRELKDARAKLQAHLFRHRPAKPMEGAVRLYMLWLFPSSEKHPEGTYKSDKPDTDNLSKLLMDCMTQLGFWHDDAQVASETISKMYADEPGIYIRVDDANG